MSKFFWVFEKPQSEKELKLFLKKSLIAVIITVFVSAFALVLMLFASSCVDAFKFGFVALLALLLSMLAYFEAVLQLLRFKAKT